MIMVPRHEKLREKPVLSNGNSQKSLKKRKYKQLVTYKSNKTIILNTTKLDA